MLVIVYQVRCHNAVHSLWNEVYGLQVSLPSSSKWGHGYVEFQFASWKASTIAFLKAAMGSPPSAITTAGGSSTGIGISRGMAGKGGVGGTTTSIVSGWWSSNRGCGMMTSSSPDEESEHWSSDGSKWDLVSSKSSIEVSASEGSVFSSSAGNCLVSMGNLGFPRWARFFYRDFRGYFLFFNGKYPDLASLSANAGVGFTVNLSSGGGLYYRRVFLCTGCSRFVGRGVGGLSIFLAFRSGPWYVTDGDNGRFLSSWEISPGWLCAVLLGG